MISLKRILLDEGIIADQGETANKIMTDLRKLYRSVQKLPVKEAIQRINDVMWEKHRIVVQKLKNNVLASYMSNGMPEDSYITLNLNGFVKSNKLIPIGDVDWVELGRILEHELIHKKQHTAAGKPLTSFSKVPDIKKFDGMTHQKTRQYVNSPHEIMPRVVEIANMMLDELAKMFPTQSRYDLLETMVRVVKNPKSFQIMLNKFGSVGLYTPENRKRFLKSLYLTVVDWRDHEKEVADTN